MFEGITSGISDWYSGAVDYVSDMADSVGDSLGITSSSDKSLTLDADALGAMKGGLLSKGLSADNYSSTSKEALGLASGGYLSKDGSLGISGGKIQLQDLHLGSAGPLEKSNVKFAEVEGGGVKWGRKEITGHGSEDSQVATRSVKSDSLAVAGPAPKTEKESSLLSSLWHEAGDFAAHPFSYLADAPGRIWTAVTGSESDFFGKVDHGTPVILMAKDGKVLPVAVDEGKLEYGLVTDAALKKVQYVKNGKLTPRSETLNFWNDNIIGKAITGTFGFVGSLLDGADTVYQVGRTVVGKVGDFVISPSTGAEADTRSVGANGASIAGKVSTRDSYHSAALTELANAYKKLGGRLGPDGKLPHDLTPQAAYDFVIKQKEKAAASPSAHVTAIDDKPVVRQSPIPTGLISQKKVKVPAKHIDGPEVEPKVVVADTKSKPNVGPTVPVQPRAPWLDFDATKGLVPGGEVDTFIKTHPAGK